MSNEENKKAVLNGQKDSTFQGVQKDIDDANFLSPWVRVIERVEEAFSSSPNMNFPEEEQDVFC